MEPTGNFRWRMTFETFLKRSSVEQHQIPYSSPFCSRTITGTDKIVVESKSEVDNRAVGFETENDAYSSTTSSTLELNAVCSRRQTAKKLRRSAVTCATVATESVSSPKSAGAKQNSKRRWLKRIPNQTPQRTIEQSQLTRYWWLLGSWKCLKKDQWKDEVRMKKNKYRKEVVFC